MPAVGFRARVHGRAPSGTPRVGTAAWTGVPDTTCTPGLPTGWQPDDIHVLLFATTANGALDATPLTGWTQLYAQNNTALLRVEVWWRRAQAGDVAPTLQLASNAVSVARGARIYGVSGVETLGSPFSATSVRTGTNSGQITFTDVTTTAASQTALALGVAAGTLATDVSTMTGWNEPSDATASFSADPLTDATNVLTDATNILTDGGSGSLLTAYEWRGVATSGAAGASAMMVGTGADLVTSVGVVLAFALTTNYASSGVVAPRAGGRAALAGVRGADGVGVAAGRSLGVLTGVHGSVAAPQPRVPVRLVAPGRRQAQAVADLSGVTQATLALLVAKQGAVETQTFTAARASGVRGALHPVTLSGRGSVLALTVRGGLVAPRFWAAVTLTAIGFQLRADVRLRTRAGLALTAVHGALAPAEIRAPTALAAPGVHGGLAAPILGIGGQTAVPAWATARAGTQTLGAHLALPSSGRRAAVSAANRLTARPSVLVVMVVGHRETVRSQAHLLAEIAGVRKLSPRLPMQELVPVNLGTAYRGDTVILPVWVAYTREGEPYDLTDSTLWFTAKTDLVLADGEPHVIQVSTADGGIALIGDPEQGAYRVTIDPPETQTLPGDTVFTFDVQLSTNEARIYTIRRGLLTVVRDVTRTST
jgi:hypothetical protein